MSVVFFHIYTNLLHESNRHTQDLSHVTVLSRLSLDLQHVFRHTVLRSRLHNGNETGSHVRLLRIHKYFRKPEGGNLENLDIGGEKILKWKLRILERRGAGICGQGQRLSGGML